jgi:uncharacterized protein YcnI
VKYGRPRMRASAAVLVVAGLLAIAPGDALAHGTISPASAPRGSTQSFVVVVPNISANVPLTGFRLTPPTGVEVEVEEDPAWTTTTEGRTLVWTGEGVPGGEEGRFGFRAHLPDSGSAVTFQAEESYPSVPRSGLFPLEVALTGATTDDGSSGSQPLIVGLIFGGVLALAILSALLLPRFRRP